MEIFLRTKLTIVVLCLSICILLGCNLTQRINPPERMTSSEINASVYDDSGTKTLLGGQVYWVYYDPLTAGTTVYMWAQTANIMQGLDIFICDEYNLNEYLAGRAASVYCLHEDIHISLDHFTAPSTQRWYFVWSNRDSATPTTFDYFLDTNGDDYPSFGGHYWQQNGQSMEPGEWYTVYSDYSKGESISGYFKSWIMADSLDFFICDEANYTSWAGGGGATVFWIKDNYISASWGPFTIPYSGRWYCVFDARDAPDTVTFSTYMDWEAAKSITVTSPSASILWFTKSYHTISWSSTGIIPNVRIELYKNSNLVSVITSSTSNDGHYFWFIPSTLTSGTDYRIKILSTTDSNVFDYSPYFEIIQTPEISVIEPSWSSYWTVGNNYTIQWTSTGSISTVKIELYSNSKYITTIAYVTPNNGSLLWSIPLNLAQGSYYRIKITSTTDSSIYDYSDYFTIYTNNPTHMPIPGFTVLLSTFGFALSLLFRNRFKTKKPV